MLAALSAIGSQGKVTWTSMYEKATGYGLVYLYVRLWLRSLSSYTLTLWGPEASTNSRDPDEMRHRSAVHRGLYCLEKPIYSTVLVTVACVPSVYKWVSLTKMNQLNYI